jgi:hypothetical protein
MHDAEFTTLRYACLGEYGTWEGRTSLVPTKPRVRIPRNEERLAEASRHLVEIGGFATRC